MNFSDHQPSKMQMHNINMHSQEQKQNCSDEKMGVVSINWITTKSSLMERF